MKILPGCLTNIGRSFCFNKDASQSWNRNNYRSILSNTRTWLAKNYNWEQSLIASYTWSFDQ